MPISTNSTTTSTVTTTANLDISDDAIERLVERHLRRTAGIPTDATVTLQWCGSQCPYLTATITHQRPARTSVGKEDKPDWADRLADAFD